MSNKQTNFYAPLAAQYGTLSDARLSLDDFARLESVLGLLFQLDPTADPSRAYLLFTGYECIGMGKTVPAEHILQNLRTQFPRYRSKKIWTDDFCEYRRELYAPVRAFDVVETEQKKCVLQKRSASGAELYPYEQREKEWKAFWQTGLSPKLERTMAQSGKMSYTRPQGDGEEAETARISLSRLPRNEAGAKKEFPRPQHTPIRITVQELLDTAAAMKELDPRDYCYDVFRQNVLKVVQNGVVSPARDLCIQQVTNMVGMVGSGKSTLIKILAFWCSRNDRRVVIVLDTVTDVIHFWTYLRSLQVDAAPLVGRGERLKYIEQVAKPREMCLAPELSRLLTPACLLDGLDDHHETAITYGKEPCYRVKQDGKHKLCPFYEVCPGTAMQRQCLQSSVVVTTVAGFAASLIGKNSEPLFEAALRDFDLVIFDECDRVQKTLDCFFMPQTSFNKYINDSALEAQKYLSLSSRERENNPIRNLYGTLQLDCPRVLSCLNAALRKDLGKWSPIKEGKSFSALTLLEDLHREADCYQIPDVLYRELYQLMDADPDDSIRQSPLWRIMRESCSSLDDSDFAADYRQWMAQQDFERPKTEHQKRIQDARLQLILKLIYFDDFIRRLSDAYAATSETSYGQNELFSFLQTRFKRQQLFLPSALCGNLFGLKKTEDQDIVLFRQFAFGRSLMKDLSYLRVDEQGQPIGPHVLLLSGSSWAEGSYEYHVNRPVNYILEADSAKREYLAQTEFKELFFAERVSGSGDQSQEMLRRLTERTAEYIVAELKKNAGKILLVVNSYVQAKLVQQWLQTQLQGGSWSDTVCRMAPDAEEAEQAHVLRRGEVSHFADRPEQILIAPALAIERGHNIVDETGHSALGAIFFLVRPMAVPDDIQQAGCKLNGYLEANCQKRPDETIFQFQSRMRQDATIQWAWFSKQKVQGIRNLTPDEQQDIVATLFVLILQIFGRMARITDLSKPVPRVYFADGAFRKKDGVEGDWDCLEALEHYLDQLMAKPETCQIAATLYRPFYDAFKKGVGHEHH